MSQHALQPVPSSPQQSDRRAQLPTRRSYSAAQIIGFLNISKSTFYEWKRLRLLSWLVALETPSGRAVRYRADLVDAFFANRPSGSSRLFFGGAQRHGRESRVRSTSSVSLLSGQLREARKGVRS